MTSLQGKRVLVTGATAGIGAACARAFAALGCALVLVGRREDRLAALAAECQERWGTELATVAMDVREREAVGAIRWPPVDLLVNNAGLALGMEPLQDGDPGEWDEVLDTNVKGLLYFTRALLPAMIARGEGHVINVGSVAGHWTYPGGAVYCASKHAVKAISEALRLDLHGTGVRVSSVDPGMVETEFSEVRFRGDRERARKVYEGMTALSAEDVAETVAWCATRPPHVNVCDVILMPVDQASVTLVRRRP
jgi:serine 3-dehydrogenase